MPDSTTDHKPKYDLSPEEAIAEMEVQLVKMRAETDREQLRDIDADTAYELGYETALFDYRHFTGPNPSETGIIIYTREGADDAAE